MVVIGLYGRRRRGKVCAAIDLGTNSCRLLVVRPEPGGYRVIDSYSRITRLGQGLDATGRLSDASMERTIAALRVCAGKIRRQGAVRERHVATDACRRADNSREFIERVRDRTGLVLEIVPPVRRGSSDVRCLPVSGCSPCAPCHHGRYRRRQHRGLVVFLVRREKFFFGCLDLRSLWRALGLRPTGYRACLNPALPGRRG